MTESKIRIAVLDDYQKVAHRLADWTSLSGTTVEFFDDHTNTNDELARRLEDFDCLVMMRGRTPLPGSVIRKLDRLRLIVRIGRNAAIDLKAAEERGIIICGTRVIMSPTVELTWGLILELCRRMGEENAAIRKGVWQTTIGTDLHGKTLGILGLGKLGTAVGAVGRAFGMEVVTWSPNLTAERATAAEATLVTKDELFQASDILSIHLVLSDRTRGLVGSEELRQMKSTAYLVNTSRASIVQEKALLDVLRNHRIAGAGLDVFEKEPIGADDPLLKLDSTILTPHLGYVSEQNFRLGYGDAVENIRAFMAGNPIRQITSAHDPY